MTATSRPHPQLVTEELYQTLASAQAVVAPSGGGPHDPGMEARVAKLEAHAEHIQADLAEIKIDLRSLRSDARADFRMLFGALITTAIGLAALIAKGFHWL